MSIFDPLCIYEYSLPLTASRPPRPMPSLMCLDLIVLLAIGSHVDYSRFTNS